MDSETEVNKPEETEESWLTGTGRYCVLKFSCSVISKSVPSLPAHRLHITYKTIQAETKLLNILLNSHGVKEVSQDAADFNLLWTGSHVKPQVLRNLLSHQRVNHFPRSYELTRKDRLYKNIEQMQYTRGLKQFDFVPQTFILPNEFNELLTSQYRHRGGAWIVKPVASSRGRGIYIVDSVENIPLQESVVVAKYIQNPLLVNGCKCDLRLYVLVTSYNPLLIYLYEEGLVRFATVKYDCKQDNLWNPCMHLCNYSINKHHSDYIKSSDPEADDIGHKWTLSAFLKYLRTENQDVGLLMHRIEDVIIKAILATAPSIVTACKLFVSDPQNCFELYGFDILVDAELKPWLLEVNLSPSLGCDTLLDTRLKSALLTDLLTLIGIPAVDPVTRPNCMTKKRQQLSLTRQMHSADSLSKICKKPSKTSKTVNRNAVTPDELRLLRMVQEQFNRKGCFITIFPSSDTWKKYSAYLDPITGVPSFGLPQIGVSFYTHQNYNKLIHAHFYPKSFTQRAASAVMTRSLPSICRIDRLKHYERTLNKGYKMLLDDRASQETYNNVVEGSRKKKLIKQEILKYVKNGYHLSLHQEKMLFCEYLNHILRSLKIKSDIVSVIEVDNDVRCNNILRFLDKFSNSLNEPLQFKKVSCNLKGNDKIAVTAKYLSDFILEYSKDITKNRNGTDDSIDSVNIVPDKILSHFIQMSSESELEEILNLNSQFNKSQFCSFKSSELHKLSHLFKK